MLSYDLSGLFRVRWTWFAEPQPVTDVAEAVFFSYTKPANTDFRCREGVTTIINLTQSEDVLWEAMRKKFIRKQITRGESREIIVRQGSPDEFMPIYRSFRTLKNIPLNDAHIVASVGTVFIAEHEGNILAVGLFLADETVTRAYALASVRFDSKYTTAELVGYANRLLIWRAMQFYKNKKYTQFDLGGINPESSNIEERSLTEFKEAFGGVRTPCFYYRKTYSPLLRRIRRVRNMIGI